jgi:hypothetical protein
MKRISVLERLKPGEAETVLRRLLAVHSDLGDEAEQIARSVLGEVSFESVAEEVEYAVYAELSTLWAPPPSLQRGGSPQGQEGSSRMRSLT